MSARGNTIDVKDTLVVEQCCNCYMLFAMPEEFYDKRKRDHGWFHCPAGHSQHYTGKSDEERLRDQLAQRDRLIAGVRAERDATERSLRATRGHVTRLKHRIAKGKCPCCSEEFPDVAAHIAEAHPGYVETDDD